MNNSSILIILTSFLPQMVQSIFHNLITCLSIPSLSITLKSRYLQGEIVIEIRDLYLFLFSGSLNSIPWFRTVDCLLLAPLLEPSISLLFLFDAIDVNLTWCGFGRRFGLDKVLCGKGGFSDGVWFSVRFMSWMMEIGEEFLVFGLGFNGVWIWCLDGWKLVLIGGLCLEWWMEINMEVWRLMLCRFRERSWRMREVCVWEWRKKKKKERKNW